MEHEFIASGNQRKTVYSLLQFCRDGYGAIIAVDNMPRLVNDRALRLMGIKTMPSPDDLSNLFFDYPSAPFRERVFHALKNLDESPFFLHCSRKKNGIVKFKPYHFKQKTRTYSIFLLNNYGVTSEKILDANYTFAVGSV